MTYRSLGFAASTLACLIAVSGDVAAQGVPAGQGSAAQGVPAAQGASEPLLVLEEDRAPVAQGVPAGQGVPAEQGAPAGQGVPARSGIPGGWGVPAGQVVWSGPRVPAGWGVPAAPSGPSWGGPGVIPPPRYPYWSRPSGEKPYDWPTKLLIFGGSQLGGSWFITIWFTLIEALGNAFHGGSADWGPMLIPIAGPFIELQQGNSDSFGNGEKTFGVLLGLSQSLGLATLLVGAGGKLAGRPDVRRNDPPPTLRFSPAVSQHGATFGLTGTF